MNRPTAVLFGILCTCSSALGGTVEFSVGEFDVNDPAPVLLDVTVVGDSAYDYAEILFHSSDYVPITGIIFSDEWKAAFSFVAEPLLNLVGLWPYELFARATNASTVGPVLYMGRIVVDPTDFGLYEKDVGTQLQIIVDDYPLEFPVSTVGFWGQYEYEVLSGKGIINVVPEPATIFLLGLAACCLVRRRQGGNVG